MTQAPFVLPTSPVLVAGLRHAVRITADGETATLTLAEAAQHAQADRPILCHAPATARRLGLTEIAGFDLLELFAFVRPARFCVPTPAGLAAATGQPPPVDLDAQALAVIEAMRRLLAELAARPGPARRAALAVAWPMARGQWSWGPAVLSALGADQDPPHRYGLYEGLKVWTRLPEWHEHAPEPPAGNTPIAPEEARLRLAALLGANAEDRPQQADFASAACAAFSPRTAEGIPQMVLAEAGTGVGKTLAYVAPASLWAEKNQGAVWISTYTRNLQRQIDSELDRLYDDPAEKRRHVVIRKGRENYLCLLNFEEAVRQIATQPAQAVPLGLMARWAAASRDGDMIGGDFPSWLTELLGHRDTLGLSDRRGECIYAACPHYQKCYIEHAVRRARRARIVVANHALVLVQAALGGLDDAHMPNRYVFDEGHHLFDAADKAFSAHLSAVETAELRRWLRGSEEGARSRARGLKKRLEDIAGDRASLAEPLDAALAAAHCLPGPGWSMRLTDAAPKGAAEQFFCALRAQVYARARDPRGGYSLETEAKPALDAVLAGAATFDQALAALENPLKALTAGLATVLDTDADSLETAERQRIEGSLRSLRQRALGQLDAWRSMLAALIEDTPAEFVDWFAVERAFGRDMDVGMRRHWRDPTLPLIRSLAPSAHGLLVTSASLRDGTGDVDRDWAVAEDRSGAAHLPAPALRAALPSPYDYGRNTRVVIVTDVARDDPAAVAAAYRELFLAAGGGGLGLFTAISRLRQVHQRLGDPLDAAGIPLLAQHIDGMDVSTLIDIFRAETHACLLGTDAVRDGVDVPGASLRLIVFDRVPWPRPDILHRARKAAFHGRGYDDLITRLRLKQAFGRLVRRASDRGVFVLLDARMPSRLFGAFPSTITPMRLGLRDAVALTREFFAAPETETAGSTKPETP